MEMTNLEIEHPSTSVQNTITMSSGENGRDITLGPMVSSNSSQVTRPTTDSSVQTNPDVREDKRLKHIFIGSILGLGLGIILGILVGYLLASFLTSANDLNIKDNTIDKFGTTKYVIESVYEDMRKSMNSIVPPCNNFYEFSCGNYRFGVKGLQKFTFHDSYEENVLRLDQLMEGILNMTSTVEDHPVIKYARAFFYSCLAYSSTTANVSSDIRTAINKILNIPSWPITEVNISLDENYISEKIAELNLQLSLTPLFHMDIFYPSTWTGEKHIFEISEPVLILPTELQSTHLNSSSAEFQSFVTIVVGLLQEFGWQNSSLTTTQLRELSTDIILFEHGLFVLQTNPPKDKDIYEKVCAKDLDELAGNTSVTISVRHTLNYLLYGAGRPLLKDDDNVRIFNSTVLSTLLSYISSAKPETLVNYLGYRIIAKEYSDFSDSLNMNVRRRRAECLAVIQQVFLPALISHVPSEVNVDIVIKDIRGMFLNFKNELILTQMGNSHLNSSQRARILDGIEKIQFCPDKLLMSSTELDEHYSLLSPFKESYLDQMSDINRWIMAKIYSLHGKVQPDDCHHLHGEPGGATYPLSLQIYIAPSMWMEPFYNVEWPLYMKYSGVGSTIGHEMMHILYLLNPDLGSTRQCIINHYEGFSRTPFRFRYLRWSSRFPKINGTITLEEDFADIGGIQLAYAAYKTEMKKEGIESPILTNYSNDQLFFQNYARGFCDPLFPIERIELVPDDTHSLNVFRVLGALRNNEDFAEVWKCRNVSFMNPVKKCPIFIT